jgi:hypothetical protein
MRYTAEVDSPAPVLWPFLRAALLRLRRGVPLSTTTSTRWR